MRGSQPKAAVTTRKRRTISAAGRKRIAAAQRARWAKIKGQKIVLHDWNGGRIEYTDAAGDGVASLAGRIPVCDREENCV